MNKDKYLLISDKNKELFCNICKDLKSRTTPNPWTPLLDVDSTAKSYKLSENYEYMEIIEDIETEIKLLEKIHTSPIYVLEKDTKYVTQHVENGSFIYNANVEKLKEALHSEYCREENLSELSVFYSIPAISVSSFCDKLELFKADEKAIAAVLNVLGQIDPLVSTSTAASIVQHAVVPRLNNIKPGNVRVLTTAIVKFCEKYPKAIIEKLVLPVITSEQYDSVHTDIISRITKLKLPDDVIDTCIRELLNVGNPNESTFAVLQNLVEKKICYSEGSCNILIQKLHEWSALQSTNVKFMRLMLAVITCYGNKVTDQQLSLLHDIVKSSNTVLRKSAENMINRLQRT